MSHSAFALHPVTSSRAKTKQLTALSPVAASTYVRPWYLGADCVMHFQNRDPDMNTKLYNDTANTLSYKQRWRLAAAPS